MNVIGLEGLALSTSLVQLAVVLWLRLDSRISMMRANAV